MKRTLFSVLSLALMTLTAGCVDTNFCADHESLKPCPRTDVPPTIRRHVYLFMMNGGDVLEVGGMQNLRDQLCHAGYAKIYYAQLPDSDFFYEEMVRLRFTDPSARFVLMGYGLAASKITRVAQLCVPWDVPIDTIIYLDPVGLNCDLAATLPYSTLAVRSENWKGSQYLQTNETVVAAGVSHYGLPRSKITFETVLERMHFSSQRVVEPIVNLPRLTLRNEPPPTPRPIDPATFAGPLDEWDFLKPLGPFPNLLPISFHPWDSCPKPFLPLADIGHNTIYYDGLEPLRTDCR